MKVQVKTSRSATLNEVWEMDVPDDTVNAELGNVVQRLFWAGTESLEAFDEECVPNDIPTVTSVRRR